ncbi:hypothetical protein P5673_021276 [Acropora cervicornis]|uniref:Uncharacterized protein n=1 Tax=Acropora cervicornis TaxID=6130 RepID=A0AAD9Q8K2_ACRCE|nr:hypothetical protein P5673_021276 [Acropora cervicornis]
MLAKRTNVMTIIEPSRSTPNTGTPSEVIGRKEGIISKNTVKDKSTVVTKPTRSPLSTKCIGSLVPLFLHLVDREEVTQKRGLDQTGKMGKEFKWKGAAIQRSEFSSLTPLYVFNHCRFRSSQRSIIKLNWRLSSEPPSGASGRIKKVFLREEHEHPTKYAVYYHTDRHIQRNRDTSV